MNNRLFSLGSAGLRGIVGAGLTPAAAADFASALAAIVPKGEILVGTDPRGSSEMLRDAVLAALAGCGRNAVNGGILTAGMMHDLIPALHFAGGILISGGHQAAGWNALIPLAEDGSYFEPLRQREFCDLFLGGSFRSVSSSDVGKTRTLSQEELAGYWTRLAASVDAEAIRMASFTLVADFCNGAGSPHAKKFAETFNLNLIGVNDTPSPVIPRDPEPRPRTGAQLRAIVPPLHAAAGLIFNSDLSRVSLVSNTGEPLSEEMTYPLAADYLLEKTGAPNAVLVGNICSSRMLDDVAGRHRATLHKTKVGQASVINLGFAQQALLTGEGCGCFTFGDLRGFDGFRMSALLLECIAGTGGSLAARVERLPRYLMVKKTLPFSTSHAYRVLHHWQEEFSEEAECSDTDGLRFDWPDGFLSIRISKTEALVRLISESRDPELAERRAWRARRLLEHYQK